MVLGPLTTQIVGSYRKPHWLGRHQHMRALDDSWWRPEKDVLQEAKEDAVRLAVYEQEQAGLDLITDGEPQRPSYDRHFLHGLSGIDVEAAEIGDVPWKLDTNIPLEQGFEDYEHFTKLMPKVVGDIKWRSSVASDELAFLKQVTRKPKKVNIVGPVTLSGNLIDTHYEDRRDRVLALARALNKELSVLENLGADVLQVDEPGFQFDMELTRSIAAEAITELVQGLTRPVIVHVCYGYAFLYKEKKQSMLYPEVLELLSDCPIAGISIEYEQPNHQPDILKHCGSKHVVIGLLNLGTESVESAEHIATRLRDALDVVPADRLHPSSDCGMWFLPHDAAFGKIRSLVQGTDIVRKDLGVN